MIESFLSPRLLDIISLVKPKSRVLDIGCDHAYVPIYLVLNGISDFAIASDVKPGPVKMAMKNVMRFGLKDKISIRHGSGFDTIDNGEVDTVIIAGMGGQLMIEILEDGQKNNKISGEETLILSPHTVDWQVREYLDKAGYRITCEHITKEGNKFYNSIVAKRQEGKELDAFSYYVNSHMMKSPNILEYIKQKLRVNQKIKAGLEQSENQDGLQKTEWLIDNYKRALEAVK